MILSFDGEPIYQVHLTSYDVIFVEEVCSLYECLKSSKRTPSSSVIKILSADDF